MYDRTFTIKEANKLLSGLSKLLIEAKRVSEQLISWQDDIQPACDRATYDGGSPLGPSYVQKVLDLHEITLAISKKGVLVKDLQRGLCDFPHELDGRIVYLCWELGEEEIKWWHETTDGYAGRKPLVRKSKPSRK